jgi:uncharacterized membrane protein YkvA (DUF1232 family)
MNMSIERTNRPNPLLAAYMHYVSDEGINLDRFVEQGGRLLGREESASLAEEFPALREKIVLLRNELPHFARQLEFLADFFESDTAKEFEQARNETAFALLYAVKDNDMMPDTMPGVGFLDDAAVAKVVLSRHAQAFERHCALNGLHWAAFGESDDTP